MKYRRHLIRVTCVSLWFAAKVFASDLRHCPTISFNTKMDQVEPFFQNTVKRDYFLGVPGPKRADVKIQYLEVHHPNPKGIIVLVPGHGEYLLYQREIIFDLFSEGFSVVTYSHRGMGDSDRLAGKTWLAHVDSFGHYVKDLKTLAERTISPKYKHKYIIGFSMGGLVVSHYLKSHPDDFGKAALINPLFGIRLPDSAGVFSRIPAISGLTRVVANGPKTSPLPGNKALQSSDVNMESMHYSNSKLRFDATVGRFADTPHLIVSGSTHGWYRSIYTPMTQMRDHNKLPHPLLLILSSSDQIVSGKAILAFANRQPNLKLVKIDGAYHVLLQETDKMRDQAVKEIKDFFNP